MGNIGSIPGSYMWPAKYGPMYVKSFGAEIAILGFSCICGFVLRQYLMFQNKKLEREQIIQTEDDGQNQDPPVETSVEKGFRYLY